MGEMDLGINAKKVVLWVAYNSPSHQCQGLFMVEQVLQTNLVVHNGLKALDTLQLNPIPLRITKMKMLDRIALCSITILLTF